MQAADFFSAMPTTAVPGQVQGRSPEAAAGFGGLFAPTAEGLEAGQGDTAFAEALLAVLGVQPQPVLAATAPQPPVEGGAQPIEGFEGRAAAPIAQTALVQPDAALWVDTPDADVLDAAMPATPTVAGAQVPQGVATEDTTAAPTLAASVFGAAVDVAEAAGPVTPPKAAAATTSAPGIQPPASNAPAAPQAATATPAPVASVPPVAPVASAAPTNAPVELARPLPTPTAEQQVAAVQTAAPAVAAKPLAQPTKAASDGVRAQGKGKAEASPAASVIQRDEAGSSALHAATAEEPLLSTAVAGTDPIKAEEAVLVEDAQSFAPHGLTHAEAKGHAATPLMGEAKATPQTVALLSAQIAKSAEGGKSTRFEVQLDPIGLGKVDVRIEIKPSGEVHANLSFENPLAASELRARSGELQTALERAGFDASKTQLSFNSGGQNQGGQFAQNSWADQQHQQQNSQASWRGAAFMDLADTPASLSLAYAAQGRDGGVDVRI